MGFKENQKILNDDQDAELLELSYTVDVNPRQARVFGKQFGSFI